MNQRGRWRYVAAGTLHLREKCSSIYNEFGTYGSQFSSLSPFNEFASSPPIIYIGDIAVAFLTVNQFKTPRVDPRALFPCIGRS